MNKYGKKLLRKFFEEHSLIGSDIESFNNFIDNTLQEVIEENKEVEPTIIPHNIDEFKIKFDKIWIQKPMITEADGSKRKIYPMEARLRKIAYAAPVYVVVSAHINGTKRESFTTQIGKMPIMLKSKYCHLHGLSKKELIEKGEDPNDPGGYFIINGTEKVLVKIEDLASNKLLVSEPSSGVSKYVGKVFSEKGSYKIPHTLELRKDGIFYLTFTRVKRVPMIVVIKALGLLKDKEIMNAVSSDRVFDDVYINLVEFSDVKTQEDALDFIAKKAGITQSKEIRIERIKSILDKYLLPHLGTEIEDRSSKAYNICKLLKKYLKVNLGELNVDDKDHYMNKRLKMSGDLLADLFRVNLKVLIGDLLYNFQRIVKRGKFPSIKVIIREKLFTSRMMSSMATGNWVGGRKGVSQRIQRLNFLETMSHLQRVVSPLSATQENFEARELHPTHLGRLCPIETPEGTNIGLKKNLAMLSLVSQKEDENKIVKALGNIGMKKLNEGKKEVYLNSVFVGSTDNSKEFVEQIITERRKGNLPKMLNVHLSHTDEVFVECGSGRLVRPVVIVKEGKPLISEQHIKQIGKNELSWGDLVKQGVIEYIDAGEEENSVVAFSEEDLTEHHTHLEIMPLAMFGIAASIVPFGNFSPPARVNMGAKNQKQGLGMYISNYPIRMDMDVNILHTPQKPIVHTVMNEFSEYEKHPSGQNVVVAVMSYQGYNMEDAIILNKASLQRGFARSTYYRPSVAEELRYSGGLVDDIGIPEKDIKGYKSEEDYKFLEEDGIIFAEAKVNEGDVVIGKTSPPRFLSSVDQYSLATENRRESSVSISHGEKGVVDFVLLTENEEGNKLVQIKIRDQRIPEIGDKFTSRHGQKGVVGLIVPETDMPYSASGIVPDIMFSPHGIPSRMTISHLIELIGGKVGALSGRYVDGTMFDSENEADIREELKKLGFKENGAETMYNGITGEQYQVQIFVGNMYYLKLKHMVSNKIHARARGPIQLLTRQPTEGRAKEGGLRLGEMEKDTFVAHGASLLLKERFDSDRTVVPICEECGMIAVYDKYKSKSYCPLCGDSTKVSNVEMSFAFKLLMDEFKSLCINPQVKLIDKY
ncbi:MAG: DNA-directed RNA polymerase subunit B' [Candidatus Woesearchaeota archaeon]|nr:DNA-directed RNA polymerase subunit B' [Candidatus Woesearchaeota archaeon]